MRWRAHGESSGSGEKEGRACQERWVIFVLAKEVEGGGGEGGARVEGDEVKG
jgi:hypothetical protein